MWQMSFDLISNFELRFDSETTKPINYLMEVDYFHKLTQTHTPKILSASHKIQKPQYPRQSKLKPKIHRRKVKISLESDR